MELITKVLGGISIFLLIMTIICGVWIRFHPIDDHGFHFVLSLITVIISLATIILFMFR